MENKLGESLSEFDQMLLEEQELLEQKAAHRGASGTGTGGSDGSAEGGGRDSAAGGDQQGREPPEGERGPEQGATTRSDGSSKPSMPGTGRSAPPPDIPDGSDDDIIARQLREAAEKEPDPVLREKLWEEYRKYKRGQSPGSEQKKSDKE